MKSWQTIAICNSCKAQKIKRKSEYEASTYLCISCFRKKRGKELGSTFGKAQKYQGKCKGCNKPQPTSIKWCKECQLLKEKTISNRMIGDNNPAWTGKHVCKCGAKKSPGAKDCRACSFARNRRSGANNGRYVKENREYWLECNKARKTLSGLMSNVCKSGGIQKNRQKTKTMLGYTWGEFKEYIESQFQPGMTWSNHGEWHIDHITPVDFFIKNNIFDVAAVNALHNLQPLWANDNLIKGNSYKKTKLFLITGVSGVGKSHMVREINHPYVIDGDKMKPSELVYHLLNKPVAFYFITIGVSTFIKQFKNIYDIKIYNLTISNLQLRENLRLRNSTITESLLKRKEYLRNIGNTVSIEKIELRSLIDSTLKGA